MAYLRQKTIRNKKTGKVYKYWQLVEGKWVDGKVKQGVLKHLGRYDSKEEAARAAGLVTNGSAEPNYIKRLRELDEVWSKGSDEYSRNVFAFEYDGMDWNRAVWEWRDMDKRTRRAKELGARLDEASAPEVRADAAQKEAGAIYDALTEAEQERVLEEDIRIIPNLLKRRERRAYIREAHGF